LFSDNGAMPNDADHRLATLETRYAFLERHVAEQDRAMLAMAERIDRLEARLRHMQERAEESGGAGSFPADEKPPHY
jgi:uncharacterized coiled-coil protein SlyX